jgi:hypothetical protein
MRLTVSLLTAASFIATAEASATGIATPQSQAAPSDPKPSTTDIISQPSLLRQKLAGNCTTTCQWIGGRHSATPIASDVIVLSADPFGSQSPPLGNLGRAFVFRLRLRPDWGGDLAASTLATSSEQGTSDVFTSLYIQYSEYAPSLVARQRARNEVWRCHRGESGRIV